MRWIPGLGLGLVATIGATNALAEEVVTSTTASSGGTTVQSTDVRTDQPASTSGSPTIYHGEPFFFDASFGYQSADLTTFRSTLGANSFTANVIPANVSGPTAQFGAGFRFYSLTLGLRANIGWLDGGEPQSNVTLSSIDAEFGLRLPFDHIEVSILIGGGYSVLGGLGDAVQGLGQGINVNGANARLALGVDYFFSKYLSVGIRGTADVLFLGRSGVAVRNLPNEVSSFDAAQSQLLAGSGSTIGTSLDLTAGPALHF